jgi:Spy/CpxP family protein refolding chaperone
MKCMKLRMTLGAALLMGGAFAGGSALADPPQDTFGHGYGMGGSMMGGYGMGGYGMGYGRGGYGMGYGMGADDMMHGQGRGYGMGSGTFGGYGSRADLHLTSEQRSKIAKIQDDVRRKHWDLMGKMQDERSQMNEQYDADTRDDAALSKSYRKMSELRQQMFDLSLAARKQIDTVLTAEQREKMKRG